MNIFQLKGTNYFYLRQIVHYPDQPLEAERQQVSGGYVANTQYVSVPETTYPVV